MIWLLFFAFQENLWKDPSFHVSRIVIEGNRWTSEHMLISETGLELGATSEAQILDAEYRLRRLPFIMYAEASLSKSDTKHQYVLKFRVVEQSLVFGALDYEHLEQAKSNDTAFSIESLVTKETARQNQINVGMRWFPGKSSMIYLAKGWLVDEDTFEEKEGAPWDVGVTLLNLASHRLYLNLNVQIVSEESNEEALDYPNFNRDQRSDPAYTLTAGYPIYGNIWGFGVYDRYRDREIIQSSDRQFETQSSLTQSAWQVGVLSDSTDRVSLPQRGRRWEIAYVDSNLEGNTLFPVFGLEEEDTRVSFAPKPEARQVSSIKGKALQTWRLGHQQALVTSGRYQYKLNGHEGIPDYFAEAKLNWNMAWGNIIYSRKGEMQGYSEVIWRKLGDDDATRLDVGLLYRNRWGQVRLVLSYEHDRSPNPNVDIWGLP